VYVEPPTNGAELTQFIDISPKKTRHLILEKQTI
ncbi:hypothetical protein ABNIH1_12391, partial [Acinetobacter baumannii ABNIH1]